ncbi:hypothetical protein CPC08DRAFT_798530 [Agrocybe pediades]|nr:hypothetical protein CPC08DRAFT_798530 [Agrocybe pediades]
MPRAPLSSSGLSGQRRGTKVKIGLKTSMRTPSTRSRDRFHPLRVQPQLKSDGVMIRHSAVKNGSSTNYNIGRTLTHEDGHWFTAFLHLASTHSQDRRTDGCPGDGPDLIDNFMDSVVSTPTSASASNPSAHVSSASYDECSLRQHWGFESTTSS